MFVMPTINNSYPTQEEIIASNAVQGYQTPIILQVLLHSKSQLIQSLLLLYGLASLMLGVYWMSGFGKNSSDPAPSSDTLSKILVGSGSCATLIGLVGFIASIKYAQKPINNTRVELRSNNSTP